MPSARPKRGANSRWPAPAGGHDPDQSPWRAAGALQSAPDGSSALTSCRPRPEASALQGAQLLPELAPRATANRGRVYAGLATGLLRPTSESGPVRPWRAQNAPDGQKPFARPGTCKPRGLQTSRPSPWQRTYGCPPYWEGDVSFDPDSGKPGGLVRGSGGPLKLWTQPDGCGHPRRASYACGGDISAGSGATNSCLALVDAGTGEKVGEYSSPFLRPEQLTLHQFFGELFPPP
jgi:hypothetical protein